MKDQAKSHIKLTLKTRSGRAKCHYFLCLWLHFLRPSAVSHIWDNFIISGYLLISSVLASKHWHSDLSSLLLASKSFSLERPNKNLVQIKEAAQPTSNSNTNCSTSISMGSLFGVLLRLGGRSKRWGKKQTKDKAWLQSESAATAQIQVYVKL